MEPYHHTFLLLTKLLHGAHLIILVVADVTVARYVVKVWLHCPCDDETDNCLGQQVISNASETSLSQLWILVELQYI